MSTCSLPHVSVLMPAYNAAATIASSIASVQKQTFSDWELIVVDDSSDDATKVTVMAFNDPRIRLFDNTNAKGASGARNHGLEQAQGRFIAFLDSDDLWHPEKLQRQLDLMARTDAPLSYTGFIRRHPKRGENVVYVPETVDYQTLLGGNIIGCLTAMYDTKKCGKVPMPPIRRRHDFALWLAILRDNGPAHGLNEPLAILRLSPTSLSANKVKAIYGTWRMYRDIIGLSAPSAVKNLCSHLVQRVVHKSTQTKDH